MDLCRTGVGSELNFAAGLWSPKAFLGGSGASVSSSGLPAWVSAAMEVSSIVPGQIAAF